MATKKGAWHICPVCGKSFYRTTAQVKGRKVLYCSSECFKTICKNGTWYTCPVCRKKFYRTPAQQKGIKTAYCSRECFKTVSGPRMSQLNRELNPTRMTEEVKEHARQSALKREGKDGTDNCRPDIYKKYHSRLEHRVVAEQMIGRPLSKGEVVHHINGDRHDNRPENLMVFASNAEHSKWHAEHGRRKWK